jgi:hypothetical protein
MSRVAAGDTPASPPLIGVLVSALDVERSGAITGQRKIMSAVCVWFPCPEIRRVCDQHEDVRIE